MKARVTTVQLAILDTKQSRAAALLEELDRLQTETAEVLELSPTHAEVLMPNIQVFLAGASTPVIFVQSLGIEVVS